MEKKIGTIQHKILTRYSKEGRDFPRRHTTNPYAIHICEVMSQQTQLSRVLPYRTQRMQDIPSYEALANISKAELLQHRSGLGFNSRALRLQECAKVIVEQRKGEPPHDREQLLTLPGIGPYTASAICAFARNMEEAVIDTNIRRVLIFLLKLPEDISMIELEKEAKKLIPSGRSRDRHNALMDYGAMYLTAKKTKIKSVSKQSKFEGSDREVRGWIIKQLVNSTTNEPHNNIITNEPRRDTAGLRYPPTPNPTTSNPTQIPTSNASTNIKHIHQHHITHRERTAVLRYVPTTNKHTIQYPTFQQGIVTPCISHPISYPTSNSLTLSQITSEFPHKDVQKIVQGLIDEGIVKMKNGIIEILE